MRGSDSQNAADMDTSQYLAFLREPYQQTEEERGWTNREFIRWGELRARQLGLPNQARHDGSIFLHDHLRDYRLHDGHGLV